MKTRTLGNQRSQRDDSRIQKRTKQRDLNNNSSKSTRSNFSVFLISRSVDVLDLKVNVSVLKNKGITLANIQTIQYIKFTALIH